MEHETIWWLPPGYSSFASEVDNLFLWITVIVGVTFLGVELTLLYFCYKYKRREGTKALYTHGSHKLEVLWTLTPAVILVGIALFSNATWAKLKTNVGGDEDYRVVIGITAKRFAWEVRYAGADKIIGTDDDYEHALNDVIIPANEKVLIKLTSRDVIHSLFVPYLRTKQDAVPGFVGRVWLDSTRPTEPGPDGEYLTADDEVWEIACAELCGDSHANMRGQVRALPAAEFDRWLASQQ